MISGFIVSSAPVSIWSPQARSMPDPGCYSVLPNPSSELQPGQRDRDPHRVRQVLPVPGPRHAQAVLQLQEDAEPGG